MACQTPSYSVSTILYPKQTCSDWEQFWRPIVKWWHDKVPVGQNPSVEKPKIMSGNDDDEDDDDDDENDHNHYNKDGLQTNH